MTPGPRTRKRKSKATGFAKRKKVAKAPKFNTAQLGIKYYLNGFPKSGLHLLDLLIRPLALPMPYDQFIAPWVGTFAANSWRYEHLPLNQTTFGIGRTLEGFFTKGHLGYLPLFEQFLFYLGIGHIFIYRDFRDVAVSQTYHLLYETAGDNSKDMKVALKHPGKEELKQLGGFDEMLMGIIGGIAVYPGVMARWEQYSRWLEVNWVLSLKFEDARLDPHGTAEKVIEYTIERMGNILTKVPTINKAIKREMVDAMVKSSRQTHKSLTFRKGAVGDWKDHFKEEHVAAFKLSDRTNALVSLGYEEDEDWSP